MAPDADKLRQRKTYVVNSSEVDSPSINAIQPLISNDLDKLKGTEIAIDGVIYDISNFKHPGGESIMVFGGNDVTVQYKMIHPYHTKNHLEKMLKVGQTANYETDYKFDTAFEREIKKEVFKIVPRGAEFGTWGWHFRCYFYVASFFYLQYLWMTQGPNWMLAIIYGFSQSFIGLNVQHDANHGAASKKPWVNDLFGLGADFIGGSKWLWIEQHWTHHAFTNHAAKDPDSFAAEPLLLWNDYPLDHPKRRWHHRFQAFYYSPVLALYWVSSVFNTEVFNLEQSGAKFVGMKLDNDYIKKSRKFAVGLRVLYIYCNIIAPFLVEGKFTWRVFNLIMLMGIAESLLLACLFSLSHNFDESDRDPTAGYIKTGEPVCWFKSQVESSCTYGSFISGGLTGGLNFQVEHHLFPRMSSSWYPYIAPKVREICKKHGVKYVYYPWIWQNLYSTVSYINKSGTGANWMEHFMDNPLSGKM